MYCKYCGSLLNDNADVCLHCGRLVKEDSNSSFDPDKNAVDTGSIGWGFLGFFFPLIGFILFLAWRKDAPKNSKMAIKGAIIGVLLSVCMIVLMISAFERTYTELSVSNIF